MKRHRRAGSLAITAILFVCALLFRPRPAGHAQTPQNPIQAENARAGTTAWQLDNASENREIEGYASAVSINRGESITFFVSTSDPTYTVEIFRTGWYGGTGSRRITQTVVLTCHRQATPATDPVTGMIDCNWAFPFTISTASAVPSDWVSGFYLAKLT